MQMLLFLFTNLTLETHDFFFFFHKSLKIISVNHKIKTLQPKTIQAILILRTSCLENLSIFNHWFTMHFLSSLKEYNNLNRFSSRFYIRLFYFSANIVFA